MTLTKDDDQQRESNSISIKEGQCWRFAARQELLNIVHSQERCDEVVPLTVPDFSNDEEVESKNVEYLCIKDIVAWVVTI